MQYVVGLDVGGTKCAVILAKAGLKIEMAGRIQFPSRAEEGFAPLWERIVEKTEELVTRHGLSFKDIRAIGVSCGGPLNGKTGRVLSPPNLPGWDDIPITQLLTGRFQVPAFLQNDANAGALAEWKLGAGRGSSHMLFLTMGTGFGCGVISDGRLLTGVNDLLGEVGHIRLAPGGPVGFGKAGSAEGYCGGSGIKQLIQIDTKEQLKNGHTPAWVSDGYQEEDFSAKLLSDYAEKGDPDALRLWDTIGEKLGEAVSYLIDLFNPSRVVIGSIFARCEKFLRPSMERAIEREAIPGARAVCEIRPAQLGDQIGDYASVLTACLGLGLMPVCTEAPKGCTRAHYDMLFDRYPQLKPLSGQIMDAFCLLRECFASGHKLLICGNGGSAADADHIVGELMKGFYLKRELSGNDYTRAADAFGNNAREPRLLQKALPAIALTNHSALFTAFSNDVEPDLAFAQQVLGYGKKGDVLIAISTSGNSKNVCNAVKLARQMGLRTIALTGPRESTLSMLCEVTAACPGESTAQVQECHLPVYHTLCAMIEAEFFG